MGIVGAVVVVVVVVDVVDVDVVVVVVVVLTSTVIDACANMRIEGHRGGHQVDEPSAAAALV